MLKDKEITEFLDELSSSASTPGGGSVAALFGASGAALLSMVANLTIGKDGYEEYEKVMEALKSESLTNLEELEGLIDADAEAFNEVMDAFKLPGQTSKEKEKRERSIQKASKKAARVPFETMKKSYELLEKTESAAQKGNKNVISDAGIAAIALHAAIKAAYLNVIINLNFIDDTNFSEEVKQEADSIMKKSEELSRKVFSIVKKKIEKD